MAHKEYSVIDILDLLRRVKAKDSLRHIARSMGIARKTLRNYIQIATKHGFDEKVNDDKLPDIAVAVFRSVRGESKVKPPLLSASAPLLPHHDLIKEWLENDSLTLTKVQIKLGRMGVNIAYSTLYRYAKETLGFGSSKVTVRLAESKAGEVAQVDFGRMGIVYDPNTGKNRVLHALVITLVYSRHLYVYLAHRQNLDAFISGIDEAFNFFGGVTRRLILDNLKAAVIKSDRYEAVFNRTFLEYSQHTGFIIDPAVARHPQGKATVENQVRYVRENFFKGESFISRDQAQDAAILWCRNTAGLRIHGTTRKRPLLEFEQNEQACLLSLPEQRFEVPVWAECKVHPDHHIRFKNSLYSLPTKYIGKKVDVKGTGSLVRIYLHQQLIKTHSKIAPGRRSTDFSDYPKEKSAYAMRDISYYIRKAKEAGEKQGAFMTELLSGDVPWAYIRQAQQLLRLSDKYGIDRVEVACNRALAFGLIKSGRVERIIKQGLAQEPQNTGDGQLVVLAPAKFTRDANYFSHDNGGNKVVSDKEIKNGSH